MAFVHEPIAEKFFDESEEVIAWAEMNNRLISIIIPTLNEAGDIASTLATLVDRLDVEIIVADGGSTDATVEKALSAGARLVRSPPGRALQMNSGASAARGDTLLFLHADCLLPPDFADHVHEILARPRVMAGAFRLSIKGKGRGLRLLETAINFRSTLLQMPYGDQALFLARRTFDDLGGFPELPIMEDFELVRKLRQKGQVRIAPAVVRTSARRWQRLGLLKTTLVNQMIIAAYLLGVRPERLAAWYK